MENSTKFTLSKWLIFTAVLIAITGHVYTEVLVEIYVNLKPIDPHSPLMDIAGVLLCSILLSGLYLGSRGLEKPLSLKLLAYLFFTYPTRLILVPYLALQIIGIIKLEFFS